MLGCLQISEEVELLDQSLQSVGSFVEEVLKTDSASVEGQDDEFALCDRVEVHESEVEQARNERRLSYLGLGLGAASGD